MNISLRTDAAVEPDVAVLAELPPGSYPEIRYLAALTGAGSHPAGESFLEYLMGDQAREILQSLGFVTDKVD